jgi:pantoate--beta-alanine ligase
MAKIIRSVSAMQKTSDSTRKKGLLIGLVPTMGYLHEGHISLVKAAKMKCDYVVVSIFVNPTQFGPKEDLKKYPRDLERDLKILSKYKVDAVFYPDASEIYPDGYKTYIEVNELQDKLCGKSRPEHFRGVATVVAKLFNIIKPDYAFFGMKDYQQQAIIKKMVGDLNMSVKVISLPTFRELNGLAMSSRNKYMNTIDRNKAAIINRSLDFAKKLISSGIKDPSKIRSAIVSMIRTKPGIKIDYIAVVDPETLETVKTINGKTLVAIAAFIGRTRLIDNIVV